MLDKFYLLNQGLSGMIGDIFQHQVAKLEGRYFF